MKTGVKLVLITKLSFHKKRRSSKVFRCRKTSFARNALDAKITELDIEKEKLNYVSYKLTRREFSRKICAGATKSGATLKGILKKLGKKKTTKKKNCHVRF